MRKQNQTVSTPKRLKKSNNGIAIEAKRRGGFVFVVNLQAQIEVLQAPERAASQSPLQPNHS